MRLEMKSCFFKFSSCLYRRLVQDGSMVRSLVPKGGTIQKTYLLYNWCLTLCECAHPQLESQRKGHIWLWTNLKKKKVISEQYRVQGPSPVASKAAWDRSKRTARSDRDLIVTGMLVPNLKFAFRVVSVQTEIPAGSKWQLCAWREGRDLILKNSNQPKITFKRRRTLFFFLTVREGGHLYLTIEGSSQLLDCRAHTCHIRVA